MSKKIVQPAQQKIVESKAEKKLKDIKHEVKAKSFAEESELTKEVRAKLMAKGRKEDCKGRWYPSIIPWLFLEWLHESLSKQVHLSL